MIPIISIPVLNRGDLLLKCIKSITFPYKNIIILNNSVYDNKLNKYIKEISTYLKNKKQSFEIINFNENIGIAANWNYILKHYNEPYYVFINHDIELFNQELEKIYQLSEQYKNTNTIICTKTQSQSNGFNLFSVNKKTIETIGLFDESFFPCFYEDLDFLGRINLSNGNIIYLDLNYKHEENCLINSNIIYKKYFENILYNSKLTYIEKWGGPEKQEKFSLPYNSKTIQTINCSKKGKEFFQEHILNNNIINIITAVSRKENLYEIYLSIKKSFDKTNLKFRWICIIDKNKINDIPEQLLKIEAKFIFIDFYKHDKTAICGLPLRNYAIDLCPNGYIYILDDDNIMHEDFAKTIEKYIKKGYQGMIFNQYHFINNQWIPKEFSKNEVCFGQADTGSFVLHKTLYKLERFNELFYESDFMLIQKMYNQNKDKFCFINKPIAYFNYLKEGKKNDLQN